jgi:hypothetical protein
MTWIRNCKIKILLQIFLYILKKESATKNLEHEYFITDKIVGSMAIHKIKSYQTDMI